MRNCCGGSTAVKMEAGRSITISGTGSSQDPFVVDADVQFGVEDTPTFNLTLLGAGTVASPARLRVDFADTAKLQDFPDVQDGTPRSGYVLAYEAATGTWKPTPSTTANPGLITTDSSLSGDGSVGSPLQVREDVAGLLSSTSAGLALSSAGINMLVRQFASLSARAAASPAPQVGTISQITTEPGLLDYWDGTTWVPLRNGGTVDAADGALLTLSGAYSGGATVTRVLKGNGATDAAGTFTLLDSTDLADYAGVLSVSVQPTGTVPWMPMVVASGGQVVVTAYRATTGAVYAGSPVSWTGTAILY